MIEILRAKLKPSRFEHSLGVADTAVRLAEHYGADAGKARLAGLLHDCAKNMSDSELIGYCHERNIGIEECELRAPQLLHAKAGACRARELFGIEDEEILQAVRYHTTGKADMSFLEKVIFIADYIEPGRYKAKNLDTIRHTAFIDLDECVYMIMKDTLEYLENTAETIDKQTETGYKYYKELHLSKLGRDSFE